MVDKKTISSTFGRKIKVTIFGGSHEAEIGCRIEGLPAEALNLDHEKLQKFLDLRAPGSSPFATSRKEPDRFEVKDDGSAGGALTLIIKNRDQKSGDYEAFKTVPRPGHADYTAYVKYGEDINMAGGGPFSGRMTAPLCIAGGIALQYLETLGIKIGAHLLSVGEHKDRSFDPVNPEVEEAEESLLASMDGTTAMKNNNLPVLDEAAGEKMAEGILSAKNDLDSLGGVVEVAVTGMPAGIGGPMYDGMEGLLSAIYFGIPAVKGVEFGAGFASSKMKGSECNDEFTVRPDSEANATPNPATSLIDTTGNNAGGILGGITNGMPIIARVGFKPTPTIGKEQQSVNLKTMTPATVTGTGRHDPCVAVRAVPVVIAATAIGLLDAIVSEKATSNLQSENGTFSQVRNREDRASHNSVDNLNLSEVRSEIDDVDRKLTELLVKRMELSTKVAEFKAKNHKAILDEGREQAVKERAAALAGDTFGKYMDEIYDGIMKAGKRHQAEVISSSDSKDATEERSGE